MWFSGRAHESFGIVVLWDYFVLLCITKGLTKKFFNICLASKYLIFTSFYKYNGNDMTICISPKSLRRRSSHLRKSIHHRQLRASNQDLFKSRDARSFQIKRYLEHLKMLNNIETQFTSDSKENLQNCNNLDIFQLKTSFPVQSKQR